MTFTAASCTPLTYLCTHALQELQCSVKGVGMLPKQLYPVRITLGVPDLTYKAAVMRTKNDIREALDVCAG